MVFFFFLVPRSSLISITCPHGHLSLQPTGQLLEVSVREQYRHRIPVHLRMPGNHSISRVGQEGRTFNKKSLKRSLQGSSRKTTVTNDTEPREKGGTGSIQAEVGRSSTPKRTKEGENQEALPGPGNYEVIFNQLVG